MGHVGSGAGGGGPVNREEVSVHVWHPILSEPQHGCLCDKCVDVMYCAKAEASGEERCANDTTTLFSIKTNEKYVWVVSILLAPISHHMTSSFLLFSFSWDTKWIEEHQARVLSFPIWQSWKKWLPSAMLSKDQLSGSNSEGKHSAATFVFVHVSLTLRENFGMRKCYQQEAGARHMRQIDFQERISERRLPPVFERRCLRFQQF